MFQKIATLLFVFSLLVGAFVFDLGCGPATLTASECQSTLDCKEDGTQSCVLNKCINLEDIDGKCGSKTAECRVNSSENKELICVQLDKKETCRDESGCVCKHKCKSKFDCKNNESCDLNSGVCIATVATETTKEKTTNDAGNEMVPETTKKD